MTTTMDKLADGDGDHITTFEETLQRFVGLSSEEIWELQRILVRRVRCKLSETLSPEGKTAMKQVKQEMHELHVQRINAPASLVTELIDMGSKQSEENVQPERKFSKNIVLTVSKDEESFKKIDVMEKVAADDKNQTENASLPNGDKERDEPETVTGDINAMADDNDQKADVNGKVENCDGLVTNDMVGEQDVSNDKENGKDAQLQEENVQERVSSRESSRNAKVSSRESSRSVRIGSRGSSRVIDTDDGVKESSKDTDKNTDDKEEIIINGQIVSETTNEKIGKSENISQVNNESSETENTPT